MTNFEPKSGAQWMLIGFSIVIGVVVVCGIFLTWMGA